MADIINGYVIDPTLHTEHAAIRADIGSATSALEKTLGDNAYRTAAAEAALSQQVGMEACAINKHIGDARQEDAENFGHTRRDIKDSEAFIRADTLKGFGDARYDTAAGFSDARQESTRNFADTRFASATQASDIRREQAAGFGALGTANATGFGNVRYDTAVGIGDARREAASQTGMLTSEVLKGNGEAIAATKDARYETITRIEANADRLDSKMTNVKDNILDRLYTHGRDLSDLRQGQATLSKDIELNALKGVLEGQKNTTYLSDKIALDGERTRGLINDLKYHDLSRGLVERNTELVNCEQDRRLMRDRWFDNRFDLGQAQFQGQWAALQSQIQAFQSQLQTATQGTVNFGTMSGNAGRNQATNNVA